MNFTIISNNNGTGNDNLTLSVPSIPKDENPRQDVIKFKYNNKEYNLNINQKGDFVIVNTFSCGISHKETYNSSSDKVNCTINYNGSYTYNSNGISVLGQKLDINDTIPIEIRCLSLKDYTTRYCDFRIFITSIWNKGGAIVIDSYEILENTMTTLGLELVEDGTIPKQGIIINGTTIYVRGDMTIPHYKTKNIKIKYNIQGYSKPLIIDYKIYFN